MLGVCGSFFGVAELVARNQASSKRKRSRSFVFTVLGFRPSIVRPDTRLSLVPPHNISSFHELARRPDVYDLLSNSVAPYVHGDHLVEVKRALLCALVGGVAKVGHLVRGSQGKGQAGPSVVCSL